MATVEVLLSKSSEACHWMVQYLVGPEGREITKSVFVRQLLKTHSYSFYYTLIILIIFIYLSLCYLGCYLYRITTCRSAASF